MKTFKEFLTENMIQFEYYKIEVKYNLSNGEGRIISFPQKRHEGYQLEVLLAILQTIKIDENVLKHIFDYSQKIKPLYQLKTTEVNKHRRLTDASDTKNEIFAIYSKVLEDYRTNGDNDKLLCNITVSKIVKENSKLISSKDICRFDFIKYNNIENVDLRTNDWFKLSKKF